MTRLHNANGPSTNRTPGERNSDANIKRAFLLTGPRMTIDLLPVLVTLVGFGVGSWALLFGTARSAAGGAAHDVVA